MAETKCFVPGFALWDRLTGAVAYLSRKTFRNVALAANAPVRRAVGIAKATFTIVLHFRHSNAFANPSPGAFPWTWILRIAMFTGLLCVHLDGSIISNLLHSGSSTTIHD
jgi:hypothetical protein